MLSVLPLLLSFTATADAKRTSSLGAGSETVQEKAPWETKAGKEQTKLEMVEALIRANNPQEALALIAEMRKTGSEEIKLDVLQGRALRKLGLFDDADEILHDAIHHHPREAAAHHELGLLLLDRKEVEEALPELKTATKQEPDNADYLNNYGFALLSAGKPDVAITPLRAALRIDATRERTRNNLGFALIASGKPDEAYRLFRSSQTEADARFNVGYGLELEGEREAALKSYHTALDADPRNQSAQRAIARLDPFAKQTGLPSATPDDMPPIFTQDPSPMETP